MIQTCAQRRSTSTPLPRPRACVRKGTTTRSSASKTPSTVILKSSHGASHSRIARACARGPWYVPPLGNSVGHMDSICGSSRSVPARKFPSSQSSYTGRNTSAFRSISGALSRGLRRLRREPDKSCSATRTTAWPRSFVRLIAVTRFVAQKRCELLSESDRRSADEVPRASDSDQEADNHQDGECAHGARVCWSRNDFERRGDLYDEGSRKRDEKECLAAAPPAPLRGTRERDCRRRDEEQPEDRHDEGCPAGPFLRG